MLVYHLLNQLEERWFFPNEVEELTTGLEIKPKSWKYPFQFP